MVNVKKPRIFIASSQESLAIAGAIQENLDHFAEVIIWDQGVFNLSQNIFPALLDTLKNSNYYIFVFKADDVAVIRQQKYAAVRDNVIFELGLAMGIHGQQHTFVVVPKGVENLRLPSDLIGFTFATFEPNPSSGNFTASLGAACHQIKRAIEKQEALVKKAAPTELLGYFDGARDHYKIAAAMLKKACTRICLVQLSSSLILGPEEGSYEGPFLKELHDRLSEGAELIHITTLQGLRTHMSSINRSYPSVDRTIGQLSRDTTTVTVMAGKNKWPIRIAHEGAGISTGAFIKLAPALLVQSPAERSEGLFIANAGLTSTCFHMAGERMDTFFKQCENYYHTCPLLSWMDLDNLHKETK
jgi:hypothetical protein